MIFLQVHVETTKCVNSTTAILEERNNRMVFFREINIIFTHTISFIVWLIQHGRRENILLSPRPFETQG